MMYTEIVLPTGFDQVTISGVVAGSEPQVIATNASGLIELQPNDYTELIFSFGEQVVNKSLDIVVKSKLRDPEIVYNSDDVSQNSFRNTLEGTCERFNRDGTKDADMELTQDWASATMLPLELSVEPTKTSTYSGKMNSGGDSGSFLELDAISPMTKIHHQNMTLTSLSLRWLMSFLKESFWWENPRCLPSLRLPRC